MHFSKIGEKKSDEMIDNLLKRGELKTLSDRKLSKDELNEISNKYSTAHVLWFSK